MTSLLFMGSMSSCYDLTQLGEDPYALPNKNPEQGGGDTPVDPVGEYGDIDISYEVTNSKLLLRSKMTLHLLRQHSVTTSTKVIIMTIRSQQI